MTHSPDTLGSRWLGELRNYMEGVGLAGEEAQPFVGQVDAAIVRDGLHQVVIGEKQPRQKRVAMGLSIVAIGDTAIFDVSSFEDVTPKKIGGTLLRVHDGLYVSVDGMPDTAQNYTLQLDLQSGEGVFAAYKHSMSIPREEVEVPFDVSLLDLSGMVTAQNRRSAFALEFAREMSELAAAAQTQTSKSA